MTDLNRLNQTIAALRPTKGAKRPAGKQFTLSIGTAGGAILQGPRGNVVAEYSGTAAQCRSAAEAHVARIPGATLNVY